MNHAYHLGLMAILAAATAQAQYLTDLRRTIDKTTKPQSALGSEVKISADYLGANRLTGELNATGNVHATSGVFRFLSDRVSRSATGLNDFGSDTLATTCTNELCNLHWHLKGHFQYQDATLKNHPERVDDQANTNGTPLASSNTEALFVRDAWLYWSNIPVMWVPFWYYPLNTDYGWRFKPGYKSRWGGYFLSGYVYNIINEGNPEKRSLGGSTYADYRTKNGFAVGQTIRWNLLDFGKGKIKAYNAWDLDYDKYERHWNDRRHNYRHWMSDVDRERYRILFEHNADLTERDALRIRAQHLSDSRFLRDFFENDERGESTPSNEAWYEHRENNWASGVSISGPIDRFYGGTARLPEGWFAVEPQPIWTLPVNYESQTRAGYLNRDFAAYNSHDPMFRYQPYIGYNGRGADYQAFRADTHHRITLPMKFGDVLSVVPRAGYRLTYWSDSGDRAAEYVKASDDAIARSIAEVGVTAAARGSAWLNDSWRHTVEPYLDYSFQRVNLSSGRSKRYYVFDNYDRSVDWLDQFGFEGRGLPYNWHGVRPGIRNYFQTRNDKGAVRTLIDTDIYLAVPFEDGSTWKEGTLAGHPRDDEDGHYSTDCVVPGFRARFNPFKDISLTTRVEYDAENEKVSYADVYFHHHLTDVFSYYVGYAGRDHRLWDYLNSEYDRWNYELDNTLHLGFRHDVCDWFAWSPYIRHDCRRSEVEEVGAWFDFLTDCLGYRVRASYEDSYRRIDGSKRDSDLDVGFYIYLRALGPSSMLDLGKF